MTVFRDTTFFAAGPASERSRSAAFHRSGGREKIMAPRLLLAFSLVLITSPVLLAQQAKELATLAGHGGVNAVAFAPDGKTLAVADGPQVKLWDTASGKERAVIKLDVGTVRSVAFAPDGKSLAIAGGGGFKLRKPLPGHLTLWDVAGGKERTSLKGHAGPVGPVAFSADGKLLASGDWALRGEVKLWDVASGKERATLRGHDGEIHAVAISPDGKVLATGSNNYEWKLWEVATGKERASFFGIEDGIKGGITSVAFTPDSKTVVSGNLDGEIQFWDWTARKQVRSLRDAGPVWSVAIPEAGKVLASGSGRKGGHLLAAA
jgi:WD40 repeat protein